MGYRIAINGYGRIGRSLLRAFYESEDRGGLEIAAVNDLADIDSLAYLTKYDSTHGRFPGRVTHRGDTMFINDNPVRVISERKLSELPWKALNIDAVMECTGSFTDRKTAEGHLKAGAKKVVFSQPADHLDIDATIVYGINHKHLKRDCAVISNASCTTNGIIPVLKILDDELGIDHGFMTTIHSMMNDQQVIDSFHPKDLRMSRSAGQSIVPVSTGLAQGVGKILPNLSGRFESASIRVPTINVSAIDLTVRVSKDTDREFVNAIIREAAEGYLKGILGYTQDHQVSCDFNHDPRSSIVDGLETFVSGNRMVRVLSWFDNEWGYANRMLDTTKALLHL
ncbi:MAG TPA: type I glyceraldehyde-3-phosphate dehydrogenase [Desulfobacteraceae bacterium]|nr:type I glyceraldehyde-3-phosphate dehydrogenase [Desulfobacteraceae bacterium]